MIDRIVDRGAQAAGPAVLRVRHHAALGGSRPIFHRHFLAIERAERAIEMIAHRVQIREVRRLRHNRVLRRRIDRRLVPRVVHDGIEIVGALIVGVRQNHEVRLLPGKDELRVDGDVGVAIGALMLVHQAERVADFVIQRAAIPGLRADEEVLLGALHADERVAAVDGEVLHIHVVRLTGALDEGDVRKRAPVAGRIDERLPVRALSRRTRSRSKPRRRARA